MPSCSRQAVLLLAIKCGQNWIAMAIIKSHLQSAACQPACLPANKYAKHTDISIPMPYNNNNSIKELLRGSTNIRQSMFAALMNWIELKWKWEWEWGMLWSSLNFATHTTPTHSLAYRGASLASGGRDERGGKIGGFVPGTCHLTRSRRT